MVTLEEAQQQTEEARRRLEQVRSQIPKVTQTSLRQGNLNSQIQRQQAEEQLRQLKEQEAQISEYEKGVIIPAEQQIKQAQDYQRAYENVIKHYKKGKLWAIAGYGTGLEKQIAKQLIKEGYSPALGGQLETKEYQLRINAPKMLKDFQEGKITVPEFKKKYNLSNKEFQSIVNNLRPEQITQTAQPPRLQTNVKDFKSEVLQSSKAYQVFGQNAFDTNRSGLVSQGLPPVAKKPQPPKTFMEKADNFAKYFTTPGGVKVLFDIAAEKTLQAGEFLGKQTEKAVKFFGGNTNNFLFNPEKSPISKQSAKEIISSAYLFTAFAPLMSTGATGTAESEYVYDSIRGKYVLKKDLEKYTENLLRKFDNAYKNEGQEGVIRELEKLKGSAKDIKGVENLLSQLKNKGFIKGYAVDTQTGKFAVQGVQTATQKPLIVEIQLPQISKIKGIPQTATGIKAIQESNIFFDVPDKSKSKTEQKQINILDVKPEQKEKVIPITSFRFDSKSQQKTKSKELQKEKTKQAQPELTIFKFNQPEPQVQKTKQTPKQPEPRPKPEVTQTKNRIIFPSLAKRVLKRVQEEPETFNVFGRRFGRDVLIGKTSSKKGAEDILKKFLKGSLGRSGVITSAGKKIKSDLFKDFEFRPSKKDAFRVVQKSKFSLGSPQEIKEIQFFKSKKKSKTFSWFS